MTQTISKSQLGMATAIEALEHRHVMAPIVSLPPVDTDFNRDCGMILVDMTQYRDSAEAGDRLDATLRVLAQTYLNCFLGQKTSRPPIDFAYQDTQMSDAEFDSIEAMRRDGRGLLSLSPRQLPVR